MDRIGSVRQYAPYSYILFPEHWCHLPGNGETIIVPFNPIRWRHQCRREELLLKFNVGVSQKQEMYLQFNVCVSEKQEPKV